MSGGTALVEVRTSGARAKRTDEASRIQTEFRRMNLEWSDFVLTDSVFGRVADGGKDICRLGKDDIFQIGTIRNRRVQRADPLHRSVQILEQFSRNSGCNFGSETACQLVLVR